MNPMNQRIKCRSDGCLNEVFFKTVEGSAPVPGAYIDPIERRASGIRSPVVGRGSPGPYGHSHRYSSGGGSTVVSQYCKQHTCIHFLRDEGCTNKKPLHDTVCANHARCPIPECTQARAQFLDPGYDPNLHAVPRYVRFEFCADHKCILRSCPRRRTSPKTTFCQAHSCHHEGCLNQSQDQRNCCEEHQCKAGSCRTIVEGNYPYCALHIKCEIASCGRARHSMAPKSDEYLAFCTEHATCEVGRCREIRLNNSSFCGIHTCQERDCKKSANSRPFCNDHSCQDADCPYPRAWAPQLKDRDKFCPLHTCRSQGCQEYVDSRAIFCKKHGCSKKRCLSEAVIEQLCLDDLKAQYIAQGELIATRKLSISSSRGSPFSPHTGSSTPVPFPPLHNGMPSGPPRSSAPTPIPTPGGGVTYRDRDRGENGRGLPGGGVSSRQSHQQFFQVPPRSGTPVGNTLRGGGGIVNLNKHGGVGRYRTMGYPPGTETSTDEHDEEEEDDDDEKEDETSDNETSNKEDESHEEEQDDGDEDGDGDGDEGLQEGVSTMHLSTGALPPAAPPAPALLGPQKGSSSRGGSSNGHGKGGGPRHRKSGNTTHTTNTTSTEQSESESEDLNFPDPRDRDFGIGAAPDSGFINLSTSIPSTSASEEGSNGLSYPPPAPQLMFPVQEAGGKSTPTGKGKGIEQKANSGRKKTRKGRAGGKVNGYGHGHGPSGGFSGHFEGVKEDDGW
ncbi:hypothetical protein V8F20_008419 [Naviculisporaceae sp. PSN 640]